MWIVLYALGAGLLAWSGFMLLSGDGYAPIDIAANLAGWGAFTIGLGALTAAIGRLTRTVAGGAGARKRAAPATGRRREDADEVVPAFLPRGGVAHPARSEATPEVALPLGAAVSQDLRLDPKPERKPEPDRESQSTSERAPVAAYEAEEPAAPGEPELTKRERRARRLALRQEQASVDAPSVPEPNRAFGAGPLVAVAAGGGGAAKLLGGLKADRGDQIAEGRQAPAVEPLAAGAPAEPAAAESPRPIMPLRPGPPLQADRAEPDLRPTLKAPKEAAPVPDVGPSVPPAEDPRPPVADGPAEQPARASEPTVGPEPETSVAPQAPGPDAAAPEPEPDAAPQALAAPTIETRVPDWLARARARREARAKAEAQATEASGPAVEQDPRPVFVESALALAPDEPAPEPDPVAPPGPQIVREGEHNGVLYRFFDDGSVEAVGANGVRRFATVEELRATVVAARGGEEDADPAADPPPQDAPEPLVPAAEEAQAAEPDPLDKALAELEGRPAPELRIDPQDRLGPTRRR